MPGAVLAMIDGEGQLKIDAQGWGAEQPARWSVSGNSSVARNVSSRQSGSRRQY
jgi:hypothetical protein